MKKHLLIILSVLSITTFVFTVSFAWFTHTQSRQVIKLTANEIQIITHANEQVVVENIHINDLVIIDFDNDFVQDKYHARKDVATILDIKITLGNTSPMSRQWISIEQEGQEMIYLLYYEGINVTSSNFDKYHIDTLVSDLVLNETDKALILSKVDLYNQQVIHTMSLVPLAPSDTLTFQLIIWGLYEALDNDALFLTLTIQSISHVGGA